jgi:antitoxin VapB
VTKEYRAKTFKSGNSVALRLPKGLGIREGEEMVLREDRGKFAFEPVSREGRKIDLTGIYGSIPGLARMPIDETDRDWGDGLGRD